MARQPQPLWLLHRNTLSAGLLQHPTVRRKHMPVNKRSLYQQSAMCKTQKKHKHVYKSTGATRW